MNARVRPEIPVLRDTEQPATAPVSPVALLENHRWLIVSGGSNRDPFPGGWWRTMVVELPAHRTEEIEASSLAADIGEAIDYLADKHDLAAGTQLRYQVVYGPRTEEQAHEAWEVGQWTDATVPTTEEDEGDQPENDYEMLGIESAWSVPQ